MKKHLFFLCAPEGSRTPNLLIRSQLLYPVKLQVHFFINMSISTPTLCSVVRCSIQLSYGCNNF